MKTSFAPRDAGSGRWDGGPATITDPHFEYRTVDFGRGEERMVACALTYMAADGGEHPTRFDVGNTMTSGGDAILVIRESADDGADEAEIGPSFSHIDPDKAYKVSPKSEFFALTAALVAAGFPDSKLADGDISVIDGLEVVVKPKARKEGDKWPLLLPFELQQKPKAGKPGTAKPGMPKPTPKPAPEPEEEEAAELDEADEATRDFLIMTLEASGGSASIAKVISKMSTHKPFADKALKAAATKKVQDAAWYASMSNFFTYNGKTKTITAA